MVRGRFSIQESVRWNPREGRDMLRIQRGLRHIICWNWVFVHNGNGLEFKFPIHPTWNQASVALAKAIGHKEYGIAYILEE